MSRTFVFDRYDVCLPTCECDGQGCECDGLMRANPEFDGAWVKAQDAIDREAVLQSQIRTLETQLKDARATVIADAAGAIYQSRLCGAPSWTDVSRDEYAACSSKPQQFETRIVRAVAAGASSGDVCDAALFRWVKSRAKPSQDGQSWSLNLRFRLDGATLEEAIAAAIAKEPE